MFFGENTARTEARLAAIERKLDLLLEHLGLTEQATDNMADIRAMFKAGDKIAAIKAYRVRTGAGLAEAKAAVEAMV